MSFANGLILGALLTLWGLVAAQVLAARVARRKALADGDLAQVLQVYAFMRFVRKAQKRTKVRPKAADRFNSTKEQIHETK